MFKNFSNQVSDGMDVMDADGDKVGTVDEVYDASASEKSSSGGGYLRVPTGFLGMGREHHIPFSAIGDVRDGQIQLNVAKDRLDDLGYDAAPMAADGEYDDTTVERTTTEQPMKRDMKSASTEGARTLQLREEELIARKRTVETGKVGLHTEVVSEQQTLDVPVSREEVTIERHPVDRRPSDQPIGQNETISVPVHEEQASVEKHSVVYEEVEVGKRSHDETQHLSETVRREEAVVDKDGKVDIEGDAKKPNPTRS